MNKLIFVCVSVTNFNSIVDKNNLGNNIVKLLILLVVYTLR